MHVDYLNDPEYKKAYEAWKLAYDKLNEINHKKKEQKLVCHTLRVKLNKVRKQLANKNQKKSQDKKENMDKERLKATTEFMQKRGIV